MDKISEWLGRDYFSRNNRNAEDGDGDEAFCGLFIFEFDSEGRILEHTIEHVDRDWEKERGMSKVVSVTEWLLGEGGWREGGAGV